MADTTETTINGATPPKRHRGKLPASLNDAGGVRSQRYRRGQTKPKKQRGDDNGISPDATRDDAVDTAEDWARGEVENHSNINHDATKFHGSNTSPGNYAMDSHNPGYPHAGGETLSYETTAAAVPRHAWHASVTTPYSTLHPTPATYATRPEWRPVQTGDGRGKDAAGFDAVDAFRKANGWERLLLVIALGLSGTAAYISVNGMLTLYPAGGTVIIVMGTLMEALKFVGFGVVSAGRRAYSLAPRLIFSVLLGIAATVNAGGVYGWLISQNAAPAAMRSAAYLQQDADEGAKLEVAAGRLADIDRRLAQIDGAVEGAARKGRANAAVSVMQAQKRQRAGLEAEREKAAKEVADLKAGRSVSAAHHQADEAAALPVKYAAALFEDVGLLAPGTDPQRLFRWISFFILLCGDPAALAALFMVNSRAKRQGMA